jgi:hypothetical protein
MKNKPPIWLPLLVLLVVIFLPNIIPVLIFYFVFCMMTNIICLDILECEIPKWNLFRGY